MPQWLAIGISGVTCGGKTTLANALRDYFAFKLNSRLNNSSYILNDVQLISQDDYFLPIHDIRHTWVEKLNAINFELLSSLDMKRMLLDIAWIMNGGQHCITDHKGDGDDNGENRKVNFIKDYNDVCKTLIATPTIVNHHQQQAQEQQQLKLNCTYTGNVQMLNKSHSFSNKYQSATPVNITATVAEATATSPTNYHQRIRNFPPCTSIIRINSQLNAQLEHNQINILIIEGFLIFKQPELLKMCDIKLHLHVPYEKCFERRQTRTYDPPDVVGYFEMCVWPHYEKYFTEFRKRKDINFLNGELCKEKILKHSLQRIYQYLEERCDIASCPPPYKFLGIPSCHISNTNSNINNAIAVSCPSSISEK